MKLDVSQEEREGRRRKWGRRGKDCRKGGEEEGGEGGRRDNE